MKVILFLAVVSMVSAEPWRGPVQKLPPKYPPQYEPIQTLPGKLPVQTLPGKLPVQTLPGKLPVQTLPARLPPFGVSPVRPQLDYGSRESCLKCPVSYSGRGLCCRRWGRCCPQRTQKW